MNKRTKKNIIIGSIIVIVIIVITIISYSIHGFLNPFNILSTDKLGHFGDFIGGFLGVLLTAVATVLIYLTYHSQKEELELSRKLFSIQSFENTFFNMLKVHQELRKEIRYIHKDFDSWCGSINVGQEVKLSKYEGKSFFVFAENEFRCLWRKEYTKYKDFTDSINQKHKQFKYRVESHPDFKVIDNDEIIIYSIDEHLKFIMELKYPIFWERYANNLGDYFRNIYHILKYIRKEKKDELGDAKNKKERDKIQKKYRRYADILQSQLSFSELFLIFYNALSFPNMKKLVEEFDFIENLHINNLLHPKHAEFEGIGKIKRN